MKKRASILWGLTLASILAGCVVKDAAAPSSTTPVVEDSSPIPSVTAETEGTTSVTATDAKTLVTDRYHLEYDSPEYCRLDITIPLFNEDVPGGREINDKIETDWALFLNTPPEELRYVEYGFAYPLVSIHYEQYYFDTVLELVVRYTAGSLYGSGPSSFNRIYCYDAEKQEVCPVSRFMEQMGFSEEDMINKYMDAYGIGEEEREWITFEKDLVGQFFFDAEGEVQIEANQ